MRIMEITCILLFVIGVVIQLLLLPGGTVLIGISSILLASIYFYLSFLLFNGLRLRNIFKKSNYINLKAYDVIISFAAGVCLSIALVGIMFYLIILPGSKIMLLVGGSGLVFCSLGLSILFLVKRIKSAKSALIRILPVMIITLWISSLQTFDWLEYRFKDYPDYVKAYKDVVKAEGISLEEADKMHKILEEEREKMREKMSK